VEILRKIAPEPTYVIDVIARQHGHEVIRTPPYHPELQPIEMCWGILKNEVARHCDFTIDNLTLHLENAFEKVTATTCQNIMKQVRSVEDRFWEEDAKLDKRPENLLLELMVRSFLRRFVRIGTEPLIDVKRTPSASAAGGRTTTDLQRGRRAVKCRCSPRPLEAMVRRFVCDSRYVAPLTACDGHARVCTASVPRNSSP